MSISAGDVRCGFDPYVGKIPWSSKWQPTPVFSPGKFHGQRSLAGYSPWSHKGLDTTKHAHTRTHTHTHTHTHIYRMTFFAKETSHSLKIKDNTYTMQDAFLWHSLSFPLIHPSRQFILTGLVFIVWVPHHSTRIIKKPTSHFSEKKFHIWHLLSSGN